MLLKSVGRLSVISFVLALPLMAGSARIYVTNRAGTTIQVIDPATNKTVRVIKNIEVPQTAHFSPDGSRVYISNGSENFLDVLDQKTTKRIKRVPLSGYANDLAVTPNGKRVLVCIANIPGGLDIIDTDSLEKVKTLPMRSSLHDVEVSQDGRWAVVGSSQGKFATVIDLQREEPAWELPFDRGVQPFVIEARSDGSPRRIFVQLYGLNGFAIVDFAKHQEVSRIMLPNEPSGFFPGDPGDTSHGIVIAPDGKTLWVNSKPANSIFVYSLPELKLLGHVTLPSAQVPGKAPVGASPNWLTFTPDGKTIYVSNSTLKSVSAIDAKTFKEIARIPAGERPNRISTLVLR